MQSIVQRDTTKCYFCRTTEGLQKHHIFGAANRTKSEQDGLWANVCWKCHLTAGDPDSIHNKPNAGKDLALKKKAQYLWQKHFDKTEDDFRQRYGKNYL